MNSIDNPPPSPFICPALRTRNRHQFQKKKIRETNNLIINNSYQISDTEDDKFSASHQLRLFHVSNNKEGEQNDILCEACWSFKFGKTYYFCNECDKLYHKECVESPPILISPFHPKYPLQLLKLYSGSIEGECHSCGIIPRGLFYYSSSCDLFLDLVCARRQEFLTIKNSKRHDHILHYFPRKASLTCDVCALDDSKYCFYTCLQCDFIVHRTCIDMPRIILLSCHNHRLSFTYSLPFGDWSCGICRRKIDENYGSYSCTKGCNYAVHSKCATLDDVWDGKELENEPEILYDTIKSFVEIGDGVIQHFSHPHHQMRLNEDVDEHKQCQACILPLYDGGGVYGCMQCDFTLHKECANFPRIKHYVMHPHRLVLITTPIRTQGTFRCSSCDRYSCGLKYVCSEMCITYGHFNLDVRCANLSERVDHQSHPHPLFLIYERRNYQRCSTCGHISYKSFSCVECDFDLCFQCATLPSKVKHEIDEHMLTLSYERNANSPYWCQVCEETTDSNRGYYACNECGNIFHIKCILGNDPYLKAGPIIPISRPIIDILPNNGLNRPICNKCQKRCQYKIIFKTSQGNIFCSFSEAIYDNTRIH